MTQATLEEQQPNPADVVRGIRFCFRPDSTRLDNLTSKALKKKTSIELMGIVQKDEQIIPIIPTT